MLLKNNFIFILHIKGEIKKKEKEKLFTELDMLAKVFV